MLNIETIPDADGAHAHDEAVQGSLLDGIRERYERLAQDGSTTFDIPGYGGLLVGRYRRLSWKEIQELRETHAESGDVVAYNADLIADACEELLVRDEQGQIRTLAEEAGQAVPIQFDLDLARILGIDDSPQSRGAVVLEAFQGNELAVNAHSLEIFEWMVRGRSDAEVAALGEA